MSSTPQDDLYEACLLSEYHRAKEILLKHPDIDVDLCHEDGRTPLYLVCAETTITSKELDVAVLLLEKGADPNKSEYSRNQTPLYAACDKKKYHHNLVEELLDYGGNPTAENYAGDTPLYAAIRKEHKALWSLLLAKGANVNYINRHNDHILHKIFDLDFLAATFCLPDLLRYGADVFAKDVSGRIPVILALEVDNLQATWCLAKRMIVVADRKEEMKKYFKLSKLIWEMLDGEAIQSDGLVDLLRDVDDFHGVSLDQLLFVATSTDVQDIRLIEELLTCGANINLRDTDDLTPLFRILMKRNFKGVETILRHGPDLLAMSPHVGNVLHFIAKYCYWPDRVCFKLLYDLLVNHEELKLIEGKNIDFYTPLMMGYQCRNFRRCLNFLELGSSLKLLNSKICTRNAECPITTFLRKLFVIGFRFAEGSDGQTHVEQHAFNCSHVLYYDKTDEPECQRMLYEREILKRVSVIPILKISLFDVLVMNRRELVVCLVNKGLNKMLEDEELFNKYPFYGQTLKYRFYRAKRRNKFIPSAKKTLGLLFGNPYFDNQCRDKILQYMSEKQLEEIADGENFSKFMKV